MTPKDNYILSAVFQDGTTKEYDIKPLFVEIPVFKDLEEINGLFEQVRVDVGGYGISWNDNIDLSADEIWEHGEVVEYV
ncbi:MAG: DUF2442 domain-containing protein [Clostridiales bacterium]|nr:DUF2442 domain-containing protein [Clostridiales bacterium]